MTVNSGKPYSQLIRYKTISAAAIILFAAFSSPAQGVLPAAKRIEKARAEAARLTPGAKLSVVPVNGEEEFGKFVSSDRDSFTFDDVDVKGRVTLNFSDVAVLKSGYGGYNAVTHKHVDRRKNTIVVVAVVVALGGLIAAAIAAR